MSAFPEKRTPDCMLTSREGEDAEFCIPFTCWVKNFDHGLVGLRAHELPSRRPASQLSQCEKSSRKFSSDNKFRIEGYRENLRNAFP